MNRERKKNTITTGTVTFLLGYLNAYSVIHNKNILISVQTGNIVNLGIKLSRGDFKEISDNLVLILGFALGCLISVVVLLKIKNTFMYDVISWTGFSIIIWVNTLLRFFISTNISILLFTFSAGWSLNFFREFCSSNLNNGIMTGNLKNMYTIIASTIVKREIKKAKPAIFYLIIIFLFLSGTTIGSLTSQVSAELALQVASLITIFPFFYIIKYKIG